MSNLKSRISNLLKHPLFSGSVWMVFGNNFANFLAYIYHLIVGRMLGPSSYGELATIISIIGFLSVSFSFLNLSIVKFVSGSGEKEIKGIVSWFFKKTLMIGFIFSFIILIATPYISSFLNTNILNVVLLSPIFFTMLLGFVLTSFLQGLMKFKEMAIANSLFMLARIAFGVALVYLGLDVFGGVLGVFIAVVVGFITVRYFLKGFKLMGFSNNFKEGDRVFKYTLPVFVNSLATNLMLTTDVVLVKHFFDSYNAGIYASAATLGKVIFWAAAPVAGVMFPMISKKHAKGESYSKIFVLSLLMIFGISLGVLAIYLFMPQLSIKILYGTKFLDASKYLFIFGVYMAIFTLSAFFINFYFSREKTNVTFLALGSSLFQGIGIWFFHDSIETVITVSIISVSLLLAGLLIYFRYEKKQDKK